MTAREQYDSYIRADQLRQGDKLRLTAMGKVPGRDPYVDVLFVEPTENENGKIELKLAFLSCGGEQRAELDPDFMVWIKKREAA